MSAGPTFDRIYSALKERLVNGGYAPGDYLEPAQIGEQLFSSFTPVRDALHRLAGERIVDAPRHDGFRVPRPTEAELRGVYGWRLALLDLASRARQPSGQHPMVPPMPPGGELPSNARDTFEALARRASSREVEFAMANVNDRLGLFHKAEVLAFPTMVAELEELQLLHGTGDWTGLRRAVSAWHRQRQRLVPLLLEIAGQRTIFE